MKIAYTKDGKEFFIKNPAQDFHCQFGLVKAKDLTANGLVKTNTGKELFICDASFIDSYKRISRAPQIIMRKDIGFIIVETGLNKNSRVLDAGGGSGGLSCYLAHICKEVFTYEIRDDFYKVIEKNVKMLDLSNLKLKKADIYSGITDKNLDMISLDLPEPWKVVSHASKALKSGGFLVSYSPTIPQSMDFLKAIAETDSFVHTHTCEILKREWEFNDRKVRPITTQNVHTGFLSFVRKIS